MNDPKFDMYKNIVNNYFRIETFEKAKDLCVRDMMQLNQRYITEAVCKNEALNRANKLEKEKKNSINKDKIDEIINNLESGELQCYPGNNATEFAINILKKLLGE